MQDDRPIEPETDLTPAPEESIEEAPPPPPEPAAPVTGRERSLTLDLRRGVALLGIRVINVWAYAMPFPAAMNPNLAAFDAPLDRVMYLVVFMTVYTKTMPIFSMLFGAGILLLATRQEERGGKAGRFVLRRQWWLLVFGLVHSYLMWNGDILVPYAFAGTLVFLFRRKRPRTLLILALLSFMVPKLLAQAGGWYMQKMEVVAVEAEAIRDADGDLTAEQRRALEMTEENGPAWNPSPEKIEELTDVRRGPYAGMVAHNAGETLLMHLFMYPVFIGWNLVGYMLLGMMLFKTGVLTGERSPGFFGRMAVIFYGLGIPLSIYNVWIYDRYPDSFATILRWGFPLTDIAGPLVALGHIALLILAFKSGWFPALQDRLRAVGRMAFSNYIAHTVICTTIFYGHGFAQWGGWSRLELMGLVLVIWALQLWWSPWWLARFRFGPLEWLWRSLTYGKRQAFRI